MCVVSMAGDYYIQKTIPNIFPSIPVWTPDEELPLNKAETRELRRSLTELRELLAAAKKYDDKLGEPECHSEDKIDLIRRLAKEVGVDLEDLLE